MDKDEIIVKQAQIIAEQRDVIEKALKMARYVKEEGSGVVQGMAEGFLVYVAQKAKGE